VTLGLRLLAQNKAAEDLGEIDRELEPIVADITSRRRPAPQA
jgi:hypothetical protein